MQDLLILGQIPFTNIYLNFWAWLALVATLAPLCTWLYLNRRKMPAWALAVYVAWLIRHYKLNFQV